jgi:hypothetical protein
MRIVAGDASQPARTFLPATAHAELPGLTHGIQTFGFDRGRQGEHCDHILQYHPRVEVRFVAASLKDTEVTAKVTLIAYVVTALRG